MHICSTVNIHIDINRYIHILLYIRYSYHLSHYFSQSWAWLHVMELEIAAWIILRLLEPYFRLFWGVGFPLHTAYIGEYL